MQRPKEHDFVDTLTSHVDNICGECGLLRSSPVHPRVHATDAEHLVRNTDPPTSGKGARSVQYRSKSQKSRLLVTWLDAPNERQTGADAALATGLARPGCCWWHRVGDLRDDLLLIETGIETRSPITDELVPVFALTDAGRVVALQLRDH